MAASNLSVTDTYDALLTTTLRNYRKKLEDNIFRELPLLFWLNRAGRKRTLDGGYQIVVPLLYGENTTVAHYRGYDVLNVTPQEGMTDSMWDWKQLAVSISISRLEERKNSGPHKLIDLLQSKTEQAEKSMQWYLNDELHGIFGTNKKTFLGGDSTTDQISALGNAATSAYVDTTGKTFASLDHIVRPFWGMFNYTNSGVEKKHTVGKILCKTTASSTDAGYDNLGGFAVTAYTNPWWMNYSNPGVKRLQRGASGGVLGDPVSANELIYAGGCGGTNQQNIVSAMRMMYYRLSDGSDIPDLILTGVDGYDMYEAALMPLERFTDTKLGDAGFMNLKFKNGTMIFDHGIAPSMPTSASTLTTYWPVPMYFLNSKYFQWTVDAQTDFMTTKFMRPENQDARTAQILLMAQLCCSNRSKQGHISLGDFDDTNGWSAAA